MDLLKKKTSSRFLRLIISTGFIILFTSTALLSQTSINSCGGDINSNKGSISYSIGQTFFETKTGSVGSTSEGVQQPFEIFVVSVNELENAETIINVFPNPVIEALTLTILKNEASIQSYSYQLDDLNGKRIAQKQIISNESRIEMNSLPAGVFFLKIIKNNKQIKLFKIVRN